MFELQKIINDLYEILQGLQALYFLVPKIDVGGAVEVTGPVNMKQLLLFTFVFLAGLGAVFGIGLAFAAQKFAVKTDPKVEQVRDVLPGANCGACGFAGCQGFAEAVVANADVAPNLCAPGKASVAEAVALITGKKAEAKEALYARIICQGNLEKSARRFKYEGVRDCRAAILAGGGDKACRYGCLGYGTCSRVCPFGAITMTDDDLPFVDIVKCTGCRKCEASCPTKVIEVLPASWQVLVACHSKDKGTDTRKNCLTGCIACGACVKVCPFNAPSVTNNLSRLDPGKCRVCGLCVSKCPTDAIKDYIPHRPKAIILDNCNGCQVCMKVCPANAAAGELKKKHTIDQEKCIGCGICTARCPVQAIDGTFNAREVFEKAAAKKKQVAA
jgi:electron transport complex protein RnfB